MSEKERIDFIKQRDGDQAALKFAEQLAAIYTKAAIDHSQYKESIEYVVSYLKDNGYQVIFVAVGRK